MKTIGYSFQGLTGKAFELLSKYIQEELFKLGGHWAGIVDSPVDWKMNYIYFEFANKRLTYSHSIKPDPITQSSINRGDTIIYTDVDKFLQAIKDYKKPFEIGDWIYITKPGGGTSPKDVGLISKVVKTDAKGIYDRYTLEIETLKYGNGDKFLDPNCARLATPEEVFEHLKKITSVVFKVGDWVVVLDNIDGSSDGRKYHGEIVRIGRIEYAGLKKENYIASYAGSNINVESEGGIYYSELRLATEKEIEAHLIKEAKSRGLLNETTIIPISSPSPWKMDVSSGYRYMPEYDRLDAINRNGIPNCTVYQNGKWATVAVSKPEIKVGMFVTCRRNQGGNNHSGSGFEEGKVFLVNSITKDADPVAFPPKVYTASNTHGVFVSQLVPSTEKEIDTYIRKLITDHNIKKGCLVYSAVDGSKYGFGDDNFDLAVETSTGDLRVSIKFHSPVSSFWIMGNGKLSQTFFEAPFSKLTSRFQEWDVRTKGDLIGIGCKSFTKNEAKAIGKFIRELGINSINADEAYMDINDINSIMEIIDEYTK